MHGEIKTDWAALSCARGERLEGVSHARCRRWRSWGRTQRKLQARRSHEGNDATSKVHQITTL